MKKTHFSTAILLFFLVQTWASDVIEVLPLTNKILMVRFDDGYVIYHKSGQKRTQESMVVDPLDIAKATTLSSFSLTSSDDAAYSSAKNPTEIGRKSKGTSVSHMCEGWGGSDVGCVNTNPDHAKEHWLYLYLPTALQSGKSYTITLSNLAKNKNTFTFKYDETTLRSESIHVNNIGYSTAATSKYGYVYHWLGDKGGLDLSGFAGKNFNIINTTTKQSVFSGKVVFRKSKSNVETNQAGNTPNQNFNSADVYECDFSSVNTEGDYVLSVEGIGCSFPFKIGADAFREPYFWTMKGLYHNRSGIALLAKHTDWPRAAPHNPKVTPGFSNRLKYTTTRYFDLTNSDAASVDKPTMEAGLKGNLTETFGWYQDAGDWDTYYSHSTIPAELMFLYEAGRNKFTDNELNIPESSNGIPDILDEAVWLMRFYKRAKDEIKAKGWGTGGVPGARVMGDLWGDDNAPDETTRGSWQDNTRDWYVSGEDPWMTYKYAAMAAQMYYILASENKTDTEGVNWLNEAINAYNWAKNNTKNGDETVRFGDYKLKDIRMYAAVSLYRASGDKKYHDQFAGEATTEFTGNGFDSSKRDLNYAAYIYMLMPQNRATTTTIANNIKIGITILADNEVVSSSNSRACRWGGNTYFPMLVGQATTPMVQIGVMAYLVNKTTNAAKAAAYLSALHTTSDYFLGCNPLNTTWITGVGERYPEQPFHMDWFYGSNPNNVIKGIVPYGAWIAPTAPVQNNGPWFGSYVHKTIYPTDIKVWPGHERWFDQRYGLPMCEFTVHQTTITAAYVYGFLTKDKETKTVVELPISTPTDDLSEILNDKVSVFPNPSTSTIYLDIFDKKWVVKNINLLDLTGKLVKNLTFKNEQNLIEINVKDCPSSLYLLEIKLETGVSVVKKVAISQ
jgi:endoglucanase